MDLQLILIIVLFFAALLYVGRIIYRAVSPKKDGCASGCGKCAVNFDQISPDKSKN